MKRIYLRSSFSLFLALLSIGSGKSQPSHELRMLHPRPVMSDIRTLKVWSADTAYMGAFGGNFIKTFNGGQDFFVNYEAGTVDPVSIRGDIWCSYYFNKNTGFVGGVGGLMKTTDAGASFSPVSGFFATTQITMIKFINDSIGYLCGNSEALFRKSTDGGTTWVKNNNLVPSQSNDFVNNKPNGFVLVGSNSEGANVRVTTDDGETWAYRSAGTGTLNAVLFIDSLNGFVGGSGGALYKTVDGGMNWTQIPIGTTALISHLAYLNDALFVVGDKNYLFKSSDRGNNFTQVIFTSLNDFPQFSLGKLDGKGSTYYLVGSIGSVYRSTDFGATWAKLSLAKKTNYLQGVYSKNNRVIAFGNTSNSSLMDMMIRSTDYGRTWDTVQFSPAGGDLRAMQMVTDTIGFIGGSGGRVYRTTDAGQTWAAIPTGNINAVNGLKFLNTRFGVAVCNNGYVYKTTDAGNSWIQIPLTGITNQPFSLTGIEILDTNTMYITGQGGANIRTSDGFQTFTQMQISTDHVSKIKFLTRQEGYVCGSAGITGTGFLYKTTDGGTNWQNIFTMPQYKLLDFVTRDGMTIYATGHGASLFKTTNGGQNWTQFYTGTGTLLTSILLGLYQTGDSDNDTVYICGRTGAALLRYVWNSNISGVTTNVAQGWNMVSYPRTTSNYSIPNLFPGALVPAYQFNNGYQQVDSLFPAKGYWLRFPAAQTYNLPGTNIPAFSVTVKQGWNMIGAKEATLAVSAVGSVPPGIIASPFYKYESGYQTASMLEPGKGYWIKVTQDGSLQYNAAGAGKLVQNLSNEGTGKLTVEDAAGNCSALYITDEGSAIELPPIPPAGSFDLRFADNTASSALHIGETKQFTLSGARYPVTISASNINLRITDLFEGRYLNTVLRSGESITLTNPGLSSLTAELLGRSELRFALQNNYPNPFNPKTVIHYTLAREVHAVIKVYDALGNLVETLIDKMQPAGEHKIVWDGAAKSSGVYFYELRAADFTAIKKMTLVK